MRVRVMRPIDANKLKGKVKEYFKEKITRGVYAVDTVNCSVDICRMVEEQPTACDVEKITSELSGNFRNVKSDEDSAWNRALYKAIEIVKRGGRDEE